MGLIYIGNDAFEETVNSGGLSIDPWGADTLNREYEGSNELLEPFLRTFKLSVADVGVARPLVLSRDRQIPDQIFPALYLCQIQVTKGRAFSKVSTTSKGVFDGRKIKPVVSFGHRNLSVNIPYVGPGIQQSGVTANFNYTASFSNYKYLTKRKPTGPIFRSRLEFLDNAIQIVSRTGAAGPIQFLKGRSLTSAVGGLSSTPFESVADHYNALVEVFNSEFQANQIGQWWEVTESNQLVLTPIDLAENGWRYSLA